MPGLYDSYQIANSTQTPAYVGSDLAEKVSVLSQLQQQYNQAHQADDMLARTAQDAQVNEQDKPLYNAVVDKYRKRIDERAKSGNYEDMQMGTARDAYDYAGDYKAFGRNVGLVQNRLAEIQKMSDKGPDKGGIGAETADLLKRELGSYEGLKKDENGQYTNYYSGHSIAPDVNVDEKVKDWASDIVSRDIGYTTRVEKNLNGELHYVTKAGKTETVTPQQIKDAITYGSQSDQGFKDYLHQSQRLGTIGADKIDYSTGKKSLGEDTANAIMHEANKQGTTFGNVYRQMRMQQIQQEVASNAYNYGMKYVKANSDAKYMDDGLTEAAKKKLDDTSNNFAVPVVLAAYGSEFNDPAKLQTELEASKARAGMATQNMNEWIKTNGIKATNVSGQVKYVNPQGVDVTDQAIRQQLAVRQEASHQATLNQIDSEARRQTGYTATPGELKQAQEAAKKASTEILTNNRMAELHPGEELTNIAANASKQAYDGVLQTNPRYGAYKKAVADKAQAMTLTTSAMRFKNEADNKKMEEAVNNLSTGDFKSNMLGIKHIGTNSNEQFTPNEYNAIKGSIKFAGQVIGADGQQHSVFKAEDPKKKGADVIFSVDGIQSTQTMPKLLGVDAQQLYTQQMIRSAMNNPGKRTTIPLSGGVNLNLRVLGPDEANQFGNGKYKISITGPDGKGTEQNVDSENELLQKVSGIFKAHGN